MYMLCGFMNEDLSSEGLEPQCVSCSQQHTAAGCMCFFKKNEQNTGYYKADVILHIAFGLLCAAFIFEFAVSC